jgi:hypothetical protein
VLIGNELRPYLVEAMRLSPNRLVFPRADGQPFLPETRHHLVDDLRRAIAKAGLVVGYHHACRRCKAKVNRAGVVGTAVTFAWRQPDAEAPCGLTPTEPRRLHGTGSTPVTIWNPLIARGQCKPPSRSGVIVHLQR